MRNPTEHFYNEMYSYYYNAVGKLINAALKKELTPEKEKEILFENPGFSDDLVLDKLHVFNEWFLMNGKLCRSEDKHYYETNIECEYSRPVSLLEKRWLKSIITDPRIQLFELDLDSELEDVEPLYCRDDFISIGVYNDGDNYNDKEYQRNFRTVLRAMKGGWGLKILSENRYGEISPEPFIFVPEHMEYSEIEDKFSIYGYSPNEYGNGIVKMGRIKTCELCAKPDKISDDPLEIGQLTIILDGEAAKTQNVLERILIEFSHYNKRVREREDGDYIIELEYYMGEEQELAILRLMPFAQYIRVISPDNIRKEISDRIRTQSQLLRFFADSLTSNAE